MALMKVRATNRRDFLRTMGLGGLTFAFPGRNRPAAPRPGGASSLKRPNVLLILTDDLGYGDLACHGNPEVKTPNFDALHGRSVRLTDFHVDPTCSPTRSSLLTGRYSSRAGTSAAGGTSPSSQPISTSFPRFSTCVAWRRGWAAR